MHQRFAAYSFKPSPKKGNLSKGTKSLGNKSLKKKRVRFGKHNILKEVTITPKLVSPTKQEDEKLIPESRLKDVIIQSALIEDKAAQFRMARPSQGWVATLLQFMVVLSYFQSVHGKTITTKPDHTSKPSKPIPPNSHLEIARMIQERCKTMPFRASNKVPGIQMAVYQGRVTSLACANDLNKGVNSFSLKCQQDISLIVERNKGLKAGTAFDLEPTLKILRDRVESVSLDYQTTLKKKLNSLGSNLSAVQMKQLREYIEILIILHRAHLYAYGASQIDMGNCAEHASYNLYQIQQISKQFDKPITVHNIEAISDKSDHGFLVVGAELDSVVIRNNPKETSAFFKKLQGYICDSWNEGYFKYAPDNRNEFYTYWHSVKVQKVNLDFDLTGFDSQIKRFIEDELNHLGYKNLHGKEKFSFYQAKKEKQIADARPAPPPPKMEL